MSRRIGQFYPCRRCGAQNPDWLAFEARGTTYCLHHIPRLVRLRMWLRTHLRRVDV